MLPRAKLSVLHVAKARLRLEEDDYRAILLNFGGVTSARNLDARGFEAVMRRLAELGFVSERRRRGYGVRRGMASEAQVTLIQELWAEVSGGKSGVELDRWLGRFGVSALRFADAETGRKIIGALRSWQSRQSVAGRE